MSVVLNSINRRLAVLNRVSPLALEVAAGKRARGRQPPKAASVMEQGELNPRKVKWWNQLTRDEQVQYLEKHPASKFKDVPLKEGENQNSNPSEPPPSDGTAGAGEPPPSPTPQNGAGEPPPSPAPTPELKTDPETGLPQRAPDEQDRAAIAESIAELSEPGALNPGSETREAAAATLEEEGAKLIRENVSPEKITEINSAMGQIELLDPQPRYQGDQPAPAPAPAEQPAPAPTPVENPAPNPADVVGDEIEEDDHDFDDEDGGRGRGHRRGGGNNSLKILAGCLALAVLLGAGAFIFDPTLGMVVGHKIFQGFREFNSFAQETLATADNPDGVDKFVQLVAEFVRNGEIDPDWLTQAQRAVG